MKTLTIKVTHVDRISLESYPFVAEDQHGNRGHGDSTSEAIGELIWLTYKENRDCGDEVLAIEGITIDG